MLYEVITTIPEEKRPSGKEHHSILRGQSHRCSNRSSRRRHGKRKLRRSNLRQSNASKTQNTRAKERTTRKIHMPSGLQGKSTLHRNTNVRRERQQFFFCAEGSLHPRLAETNTTLGHPNLPRDRRHAERRRIGRRGVQADPDTINSLSQYSIHNIPLTIPIFMLSKPLSPLLSNKSPVYKNSRYYNHNNLPTPKLSTIQRISYNFV